MTESVKTIPDGIIYQSEEGITIRVMFVDLMNMNDSVNRILAAQWAIPMLRVDMKETLISKDEDWPGEIAQDFIVEKDKYIDK